MICLFLAIFEANGEGGAAVMEVSKVELVLWEMQGGLVLRL